MIIGVLAIQGDVEEHEEAIKKLVMRQRKLKE